MIFPQGNKFGDFMPFLQIFKKHIIIVACTVCNFNFQNTLKIWLPSLSMININQNHVHYEIIINSLNIIWYYENIIWKKWAKTSLFNFMVKHEHLDNKNNHKTFPSNHHNMSSREVRRAQNGKTIIILQALPQLLQ